MELSLQVGPKCLKDICAVSIPIGRRVCRRHRVRYGCRHGRRSRWQLQRNFRRLLDLCTRVVIAELHHKISGFDALVIRNSDLRDTPRLSGSKVSGPRAYKRRWSPAWASHSPKHSGSRSAPTGVPALKAKRPKHIPTRWQLRSSDLSYQVGLLRLSHKSSVWASFRFRRP